MKRILGWFVAGGLCLGLAAGGVGVAEAAPISAGSAPMAEAATEGSRALVADVGYRRGHYRRAYYARPVYHARPVYYRRHYVRPVYHRRVYHRPVYYRPVRYRPVYAAPVYYGGYGYGPRCYVKVRTVYTWQGVRHKPVRICRY